MGRARRGVVSWLGIVLLAFNVVAAGLLPARPADAGPAPFAQDITGDRIVVCTGTGMVVMDREGHVIDTGKDAGHPDFCVFCLPLMHVNAQASAAPVLVAVAVPAIPAGEFAPAPSPVSKPARLLGASSPRAPPLP